MSRWSEIDDVPRGRAYDDRWRRMEAEGKSVHGEADLVCRFEPRSVLDAGCGTGRVAMELDRRGIDVVGVDLDPEMLELARRKAPHLHWITADLVDVEVARDVGSGGSGRAGGAGGAEPGEGSRDVGAGGLRMFDLVAMAGNVMVFVVPGTEAAVVANMARHLRSGGRLVAGFQTGRSALTVAEYDRFAADAGLVLEHRWSTWDRASYDGGDYAVSVHRARAVPPDGS